MWLGELITERGIGNGISFIIFAGIVAGSRRPRPRSSAPRTSPRVIAFAVLGIGAVAVIVYIQEGQRRIPIQYASRVRGRRMYQGGADVPAAAGQPGRRHPDHLRGQHPAVPRPARDVLPRLRAGVRRRRRDVIIHLLTSTHRCTSSLYFLLTVGFTYFYTAFTFKPDETADQLRKNGGFIPGIRPGRPTADYLARVVYPHQPRRRALPGHRRGVAPILVGLIFAAASSASFSLGGTGTPHRGLGGRRDHEAARGPADDAQLRGLHPVTGDGGHRTRRRAPRARIVILLGAPGRGQRHAGRAHRRASGPAAHLDRRPVPGGCREATPARHRGRAATWTPGGSCPTTSPSGCSATGSPSRMPRAGAILDGFPRTRPRPRRSTGSSRRQGAHVQQALFIEVPVEDLVRRMAGRRVCTGDRPHVYNLTSNPPRVPGICDIDGSPLDPPRGRPRGDRPRPAGDADPAACARSSTTTRSRACCSRSTGACPSTMSRPRSPGARRPGRPRLTMVTRKSRAEIERMARRRPSRSRTCSRASRTPWCPA